MSMSVTLFLAITTATELRKTARIPLSVIVIVVFIQQFIHSLLLHLNVFSLMETDCTKIFKISIYRCS